MYPWVSKIFATIAVDDKVFGHSTVLCTCTALFKFETTDNFFAKEAEVKPKTNKGTMLVSMMITLIIFFAWRKLPEAISSMIIFAILVILAARFLFRMSPQQWYAMLGVLFAVVIASFVTANEQAPIDWSFLIFGQESRQRPIVTAPLGTELDCEKPLEYREYSTGELLEEVWNPVVIHYRGEIYSIPSGIRAEEGWRTGNVGQNILIVMVYDVQCTNELPIPDWHAFGTLFGRDILRRFVNPASASG